MKKGIWNVGGGLQDTRRKDYGDAELSLERHLQGWYAEERDHEHGKIWKDIDYGRHNDEFGNVKAFPRRVVFPDFATGDAMQAARNGVCGVEEQIKPIDWLDEVVCRASFGRHKYAHELQ